MQKGKGQVIKEHAYRSCHDMSIVRNMPEEVSQTAQRHARKDKDCRSIERIEFETHWTCCSFISCFKITGRKLYIVV